MMRLGLLAVAVLLALPSFARADTCCGRADICRAACTPALVSSGQQHGGTVPGCVSSCQSRLKSCLRSGVWVHMGSARAGERQTVDKR